MATVQDLLSALQQHADLVTAAAGRPELQDSEELKVYRQVAASAVMAVRSRNRAAGSASVDALLKLLDSTNQQAQTILASSPTDAAKILQVLGDANGIASQISLLSSGEGTGTTDY